MGHDKSIFNKLIDVDDYHKIRFQITTSTLQRQKYNILHKKNNFPFTFIIEEFDFTKNIKHVFTDIESKKI